jgi:DNA mismatch repair protein MutL
MDAVFDNEHGFKNISAAEELSLVRSIDWLEEIDSPGGSSSSMAFREESAVSGASSSMAFREESAASGASSSMSFHEAPSEPELSHRIFFYDYKLMGLLFGTFWLVAQGDSLYVIDQHAAHERVLYEEILEAARTGTIHTQAMLMPARLRLTALEKQIYRDNRDLFERFGFETEEDDDALLIIAVPFAMKGPLPAAFFTDLLDKMNEAGFTGQTAMELKENAIATMACKAAVKANDKLTEAEAEALIKRMLTLANPFTCPHGRPTIISITKSEIERKFKRT